MRASRDCRRVSRRSSGLRQLRRFRQPRYGVSLIALLAVLIQILVVQTHVHQPAWLQASAAASRVALADTALKYPHAPARTDDDSSSCALCQAFTHSGDFLHSAGAPDMRADRLLPVISDPVEDAVTPLTLSHDWRGRAPPLT